VRSGDGGKEYEPRGRISQYLEEKMRGEYSRNINKCQEEVEGSFYFFLSFFYFFYCIHITFNTSPPTPPPLLLSTEYSLLKKIQVRGEYSRNINKCQEKVEGSFYFFLAFFIFSTVFNHQSLPSVHTR